MDTVQITPFYVLYASVIKIAVPLVQGPRFSKRYCLYAKWWCTALSLLGLAHAAEAANQLGSQGWSKSSIPCSIVQPRTSDSLHCRSSSSAAKELHQLSFETCCSVCLDALAALTRLSTNQLINECSSFGLSCNRASMFLLMPRPPFGNACIRHKHSHKLRVGGCACIVLRSTEPNKKRGFRLWATSDTMQSSDKHATWLLGCIPC